MDDMQKGYFHLVDHVGLDIPNREFQIEYSVALHCIFDAELS